MNTWGLILDTGYLILNNRYLKNEKGLEIIQF